MKDQVAKLISRSRPVLNRLIGLRLFIFIIVFLGIYSFLVIRVNSLVQSEPKPVAADNSSQNIKRLTIDKNALEKIQQLQSQNVQVKALFEQVRNNPFTE